MNKLVVIFALFLFSLPVNAWWGKEHEIIAMIAEKNLSEKSAQQVDILLQGKRLSDVANWADSIKFQAKWSHSKRWHYINTEKDENISDYKVSVGGDILWALDYFYWQIGETNRPFDQRREALMFFVHLVADIHQPLHVGISGNAGGNKQLVVWKGMNRRVNLHKVWDGLLTSPNITSQQYANKIYSSASPKKLWLEGSFKDWAQESLALHELVYQFEQQDIQHKWLVLGSDYQNKSWPIAQERILQAGVRLAHYLNQAFQ
jgi:hypothetical protein